MAETETELKTEIREFTDYDELVLTADDLDTVLTRAKRHISATKSLQSDFNWFEEDHRENALFWITCLFSKIAVGELDSQDIQIGAVNLSELLSADDDTVTAWARNARKAINAIEGGGDSQYGFGITTVQRENRAYGSEAGGTTTDLTGL